MARLPVPVKDSDSIAPGEKSEVSGQLAERRPAVPRCRNGGTRCAQVLFLLPAPRWPFADEQRQQMGRGRRKSPRSLCLDLGYPRRGPHRARRTRPRLPRGSASCLRHLFPTRYIESFGSADGIGPLSISSNSLTLPSRTTFEFFRGMTLPQRH